MATLGFLLCLLYAVGYEASTTVPPQTTTAPVTTTPAATTVATTANTDSVTVPTNAMAASTVSTPANLILTTTLTTNAAVSVSSPQSSSPTIITNLSTTGSGTTSSMATTQKDVGNTPIPPEKPTEQVTTTNKPVPQTSTEATSLATSTRTGITQPAAPSTVAVSSKPVINAGTTRDAEKNTSTVKTTLSPHSDIMALRTTNGIPESSTSPLTEHSTVTSPATVSLDIPHLPYVQYTTQDKITVKCHKGFNDSLVKLNLKVSRICDHDFGKYTKDEEDSKLLLHVCKTLKPGYQPVKDKCNIVLGYGNDPEPLAIIEAFVESRLDQVDLFAQLKSIKKKDNSPLFSYNKAKLEDEDVVSIPLISAIVCLAVALLIIAASYGCWHQRQSRKREQRLTEELQTMENGYHDNPTLEVMETSPEMQEKKGGLNGELGDSWIVPLDNLTREDLDEEEDTHL